MRKPTVKQKRAFEIAMTEGCGVSKAMVEAGYSPNTAKNPQHLTNSPAWESLLEKYTPDKILAEKLKDGLDATRVISAVNTGKQASGATTDFIDVPDFAVRHKYLETALKLKRKLVERAEVVGEVTSKFDDKQIDRIAERIASRSRGNGNPSSEEKSH